jgi:hypothetical protein
VKRLAAFIAVASMLAVVAPAGADRAPTERERSAIARAAGTRAGCALIRVSTVRHRYKWALVRTRARCLERRTPALPRIYRQKRERGAPWRLRWFGSCSDLYSKVPQRVADDLGIACYD